MENLAFTVKEKKVEANYSQFKIGPLMAGFGQTLGVALRRVLLTVLPGAAIADVAFDGATHQFTTLPGVKEDLVEVVLNLKKVRFSFEGASIENPVKISLDKHGPGKVVAGDIIVPANLEIVNKDLVIANLADKKSKIKARMTVLSGVGYSPVEERPSNELGLIKIDALFSPIKKANIAVEDVRVGRESNYDQLLLEVWTDGTISARRALDQAAKILEAYFKQTYKPNNNNQEKKVVEEPEVMKESVAEMKLPTRTINALEKAGYKTVADLAKAGSKELMGVKNLGKKSVDLVGRILKKKGVDWL
jgi:DNA-directed RNA polymerase subunit alpha